MILHVLKSASCVRSPATRKYINLFNQKRYLKLQPVPAIFETEAGETYEQKNERLKRPLSPHLSIYKPQLTSILSISHRISGIALVGYALAIGFCARFSSIEQVVTSIQSLDLSYSTWVATKYVIALPINYHIANGVRHLMWDSGFGLTLKGVYFSGYLVLALTVIFSAILALQ